MTGRKLQLPYLQSVVRSAYSPDADVFPWKQGVDFAAYRITSRSLPDAVLRVPLVERIDDAFNDGDFGKLIDKECSAYELLQDAGVPVPRIYGSDSSRTNVPFSWMLMELVECDDTVVFDGALSGQLASIAKAIHSIEVTEPLGRPVQPWVDFVAARICTRLDSLRSLIDLPPAVQCNEFIRSVVADAEPANRLLHLDLREPNICVRNGEIVAVIDLSNCLSGDPWFELGRIHAYGFFYNPFRNGYGISNDELTAHQALLDVYALDTWALLAMIATEHLGDTKMFERAADAITSTFTGI